MSTTRDCKRAVTYDKESTLSANCSLLGHRFIFYFVSSLVYDSKAYRKMAVTRERISRIFELREILLSLQTNFCLVNAAVVCAILESISGLGPSSVIAEPRYLKLVTVSSFCWRPSRGRLMQTPWTTPVSYTHLTLPTKVVV